MTKQTTMLMNVIELLKQQGMNDEEAFDAMLHFIGHELKLDTPVVTPWVKVEIKERLDQILDLSILQEDPWDWLGEVYQMINSSYAFLSREEAEKNAREFKQTFEYDRVLDSSCQTGRMILALEKTSGTKNIYYGSEQDLLLYRMAILNMKLYNIHAKILHCDPMTHDIRPGSPNWLHADVWIPIRFSRLLMEMEVNEHEAERHGR